MSAKIYQPGKTAMQSGMAKTKNWILEFDAETARSKDPLMGWNSVSETKLKLNFVLKHLMKPKHMLRPTALLIVS